MQYLCRPDLTGACIGFSLLKQCPEESTDCTLVTKSRTVLMRFFWESLLTLYFSCFVLLCLYLLRFLQNSFISALKYWNMDKQIFPRSRQCGFILFHRDTFRIILNDQIIGLYRLIQTIPQIFIGIEPIRIAFQTVKPDREYRRGIFKCQQ